MNKLQFDPQVLPRRNYIFVFGSNEAGIHGAGAAHDAVLYYGAINGRGVGPQGQSYAIPTKDHQIQTLPLDTIKLYVKLFLRHARTMENQCFYVTPIGCGLAGYTEKDIAPLFKGAPENCILPFGWREINGDTP